MSRRAVVKARTAAGVGLIEVLVALLALSVGSLGLASLHIAAKRTGFDALQRTAAAASALAIIERMRANPAGLAGYHSPVPEGVAAGFDCGSPGCSARELAAWDLQQWREELSGDGDGGRGGLLVQPAACVMVDGPVVTVAITWEGFRPLSAPGGDDCGPVAPTRQQLRLGAYIAAGDGA